MKHVVILSGPVGAGKSVVARELVDLSAGPTVYIEGDTFWSFFAKSEPGQTRQKNFRLVMSAMTAAAVPFALGGYDVILDFTIPPWYMETVQKILQPRNISIDYVVLRPNLDVCADRARGRSAGGIEDYSTYHDLYADFDLASKHWIEDDRAEPAAIAARIRKGLDDGSFKYG